jgi:quercetin dioxygenase-like cupin family protein
MNHGSYARIQLENEHFRVTEWTIEPGGKIPMHQHDYEYVVVPMVSDSMHVVNSDGTETQSHLVTGQSYTRPAGSTHQIESRTSQQNIVFIEVERLS